MANSNASQIQINLQDNLNLNTNKSEISNFAGFRKRNSPFFNGGISPLFKAEKEGTVIDKKGNVYKCVNGNFYKNDVLIASGIEQQEFIKTKVNAPNNPLTQWTVDGYGNIFSFTPGNTTGKGIFSYNNHEQTVDLYAKYKVGYLTRARKSSNVIEYLS